MSGREGDNVIVRVLGSDVNKAKRYTKTQVEVKAVLNAVKTTALSATDLTRTASPIVKTTCHATWTCACIYQTLKLISFPKVLVLLFVNFMSDSTR